MTPEVTIRNALMSDFDTILNLDFAGATTDRPAYWRGIFDRFVSTGRTGGFFLVAETGAEVIGFIIGEVRAWEFGSPPCGWVFALGVSPNFRELGIGQRMLKEISLRLKQAGVTTLRTMVDREDKLTLSFFRSQGLRTGRYIELEKPIDVI
ncbi:MAG: GNAT family N-acetyltransferase [Deltaproteobacteria bacterium]|nr:GNAT family N-acetyltransferase [Deltaproteobacteria bacterium]NCP03836.1 GNAT family N-acetyltransferase [Deltaproteobacteria bacterium]